MSKNRPSTGVLREDLLDLLGEVVLVGARHVQDLPAGVVRPELVAELLHLRPVLVQRYPTGVLVRRPLVALHAQVDRGPDADAVQRVDLGAEQVEAGTQPRVALGAVRVVVQVPVVALGEDRHAVDVSFLVCPGELLGVEVLADVGDRGSGVKVEVDGAERKG